VGDQEESKEELEESKGQQQVGVNPVEEEKEGATYPLQMVYCGRCGIPPEYCEFDKKNDMAECKLWL